MKRAVIITIGIGTLIVLHAVFAIGGGGGGSPPAPNVNTTPPCAADVWACGAWSACSNNAQTRTCQKVTDCSGVDTPQPATTQSCATPPPAPPSSEQKPAEPAKPVESAKEREEPAAPSPAGDALCIGLPSLVERVRCRLALSPEELAAQQAVAFLPEACRTIAETKERDQCIDLYRRFGPCFAKETEETRLACAQTAVGLTKNIQETARECADADCRMALQTDAYAIITFRLYELEEEAEAYLQSGASIEDAADVIAGIEVLKQRFRDAATKGQRREVLHRARELWNVFQEEQGT